MLFAASAPPLLQDLGVIIVAAAVIAYLSHRVGTVPIVGFLVAGVVIGPNGLALVGDIDLVNQAADIGVVLLLFTIGIEFSLGRLRQLAALIVGGGAIQVGLTTAIVVGILAIGGVDWRTGVFSGFLVALSSTAIVLKLLADRGATASPTGKVSIGFLIFQDLAIVAMVLLVPMLGTGDNTASDLVVAIAKAVGIIAVVLAASKTVMPKVLDAVARTCSPEVFLLSIAGICFGTAYLTSLADVSVSLGAFLAGLVVSESRLSGQALSDILPLQILFSATFFVSVGMLLDIGYLVDEVVLVMAIAVGVVVVKIVGAAAAAIALRQPRPAVLGASLLLAQIGEFSFVLERVGLDAGLEPFGMDDGSQAFIAVTVVLMVVTPFAADVAEWAARWAEQRWPVGTSDDLDEVPVPVHGQSNLRDHVVIAGFGVHSRAIARALDLVDVPYVITTLDPDVGRSAASEGRPVLQGDLARRFILEQAGVDRARLVTIVDDSADRVHHLSTVIRATSNVPILARSGDDEAAHELQQGGLVDHCVSETSATDDALLSHVLGHYALPENLVDVVVEDVVGTRPADHGDAGHLGAGTVLTAHVVGEGCQHATSVHAVTPSSQGCEECLASGDRWVHLRVCLSCGHVGCCDSSPHRHARAHAGSSGHPIAASGELGEHWAWCYEDRVTMQLAADQLTTEHVSTD